MAAADPWLGRLAPDGTPRWTQPSPLADFADQDKTLAISPDGTVVDFGFVSDDREPARFDLGSLTLAVRTAADGHTAPPKQDGLPVDGWKNTFRPTLNGSLLPLEPYETSRSLALYPRVTVSCSALSGRCVPSTPRETPFGVSQRRASSGR